MDARVRKLAHNLIAHSLKLQPGEKVLIETRGLNVSLVQALVQEAYAAGGLPFVNIKNPRVDRALIEGCSQEQLQLMYKWEEERMLAMDCYVGIRLPENSYEEMGVDFEKLELYNALYDRKLLMEVRCPTTRWVVLRYPTPAMAQAAQMGTDEFEDFYFNVCCLDYDRMSRAMDPLKALMDRTDKVRITGRQPHEPGLQLHRRRQVRRRVQHPGRRGLLRAGARLGQRLHHLQHALPGGRLLLPEHPPGV